MARLVFWSAMLLTAVTVIVFALRAAAVMRSCRDGTEGIETNSTLLAKFREMRLRGELSETEFRTIKTILAERLEAELRREDDSS